MGNTKYPAARKRKQPPKNNDRFFTMICFQMGMALLAVTVFFAAVKLGEDSTASARQTAWLLCGQDSEQLIDVENLKEGFFKGNADDSAINGESQGIGASIKDFWQGGAEKFLESLSDFVSEQIIPPEKLPTVGESGAGGAFPKEELFAAVEGTTLAPYQLTAQMCSPVSGLVTSRFGWRSHPISEQADFHKGVDIAAAMGTPVLAALPGVVEKTGYSESYGNFVILRHSDNLRTTYNHCSEILSKEGEQIARGDRIALVGSTGISTGPHLHFEVEVTGLKADPLLALKTQRYEAFAAQGGTNEKSDSAAETEL